MISPYGSRSITGQSRATVNTETSIIGKYTLNDIAVCYILPPILRHGMALIGDEADAEDSPTFLISRQIINVSAW